MAFEKPTAIRLSPEAFRLLRELVNETSGLLFEDENRFLMERRLRERVEALSLASFEAYYRYLRLDPRGARELDRATECLTTHETYFFRERFQLDAFASEILPELAERRRAEKRIAIWSAGCSTGEEAYTIAMIVAESGLFEGWDIRIYGSDISSRVVRKARIGVYGPSSFRALPPRYRRHFVETEDGLSVENDIRAMCHFGRLNLMEGRRAAFIGVVDAVFCRNVLIYFDMDSRRRALATLFERLVPGGHLMLGHSESLLRLSTDFELVHLSRDLVYRRPLDTGRPSRRSMEGERTMRSDAGPSSSTGGGT